MSAGPVVDSVALRRVQRQVVEFGGNAVIDPVLVDVEAEVKILTARADFLIAVDVVNRVATGVDVQGNAVDAAGTAPSSGDWRRE